MEMGIDIGYGVTKAVRADGEVRCFRSVVGIGTPDTFGVSNNNFNVVKIDGRMYTVGESAERQRLPIISVQSRNMIESVGYRALLLASLDGDYESSHSIVTGLPLSYFNADKLRVMSKFKETLPNCQTRVVPQPMGSFYDALFDDEGNVQNITFLDKRIAVLDIGTYTTDLLVADKGTPVAGVSASVEIGIDTLFKSIQKSLMHVRRNITNGEIEKALKTNTIIKDGEQMDISYILSENKAAVASNVWSWVNAKLGGTEEDIEIIVLTGGGGEILRNYFLQGNISMPKSPFLANARGFCKIARRLYGKAEVPTD